MRDTLYDVLGIPSSATPEEIRKAFRQKALETHPDKLSPDISDAEKQIAEARFHQVASAIDVLGDSAKRKDYDAGLRARAEMKRASTESQMRRSKDREEWARQQEELHQARMKELKERNQQLKAKLQRQVWEARTQEEALREMLGGFEGLDLGPEWRLRKQMAEKRKAERVRAVSSTLLRDQ